MIKTQVLGKQPSAVEKTAQEGGELGFRSGKWPHSRGEVRKILSESPLGSK